MLKYFFQQFYENNKIIKEIFITVLLGCIKEGASGLDWYIGERDTQP